MGGGGALDVLVAPGDTEVELIHFDVKVGPEEEGSYMQCSLVDRVCSVVYSRGVCSVCSCVYISV